MSEYIKNKDVAVVAEEARQLLDNPMLNAVFEEIEEIINRQSKIKEKVEEKSGDLSEKEK